MLVTAELKTPLADGRILTTLIQKFPIVGPDGEIIAIGGINTDISERTEFAENLKASEERFRDFAESAADWFWEMDTDLRFTYMSPNVERVVGVPAAWHYGKTRKDLLGDDYDRDVWDQHLQTLEAHQPFRDFTYFRVGEGVEPKWLSASGRPKFGADGEFLGYRGTGRDVSDSKQREIAIRDSEKNLREILERSPIGVAIVLHARVNGAVEAKRLFANDALVEMFGATSLEEMIESDISGTWVDLDQLHAVNETMKNGIDLVDFEVQRRRMDGSTWWVSMNTRPIRFDNQDCTMVWHFNITERMQAGEALKESEAQHRLVTDSLPVMIAYIDVDERYRFVNETAMRWFGRERSEIIGQTVEDIHPLDYIKFHPHIQAVLAGRDVTFEDTMTYGDAASRDIRVSYLPHFAPEQIVIGYFALVEDITERKAMEAQLQQSQKMETVGQLTGGVAHDFNNLLGVIIGNLDFLDEDLADDPKKQQLIASALRAALSGAELTSRLLAISRKQTLEPEVSDVNALVYGMTDLLKRTLGETIVIQTLLASDLGKVEIDRTQLETALLNLAVNARHAMMDGGRMTLETGNVELDSDYADRRWEVTPGHYVMLAVSDTGTGMSPAVLEQVFEPFFTTKDVGEGSGLGLSMVHGFVKQSGGHVAIYSEEGAGTTIKLYFPLFETTEHIAYEMTVAIELPLGAGETNLVVEDDADLRQLATTMISSLGYNVLEASDGASALAVLDEGAPVDLLFTDVVLPHGMNGVKLASTALAQRPDLKVLYTSGYTDNAIVINGTLDAGSELITKPYRRTMLARRLRQILEGEDRDKK